MKKLNIYLLLLLTFTKNSLALETSVNQFENELRKFFSFESKPIIKNWIMKDKQIKNEKETYIVYVGENFKIKENSFTKNLTWKIEKINNGKGKFSLKNKTFLINRSQKNDRATSYKVIAFNQSKIVKTFFFKVLTDPIKIMSWNIWGNEGRKFPYIYKGKKTLQRDRVAIIINENQVDIAGLQETYGQLQFLKSKTSLKNSFQARRGDNLSVLSRFKVDAGIRTGSDFNHLGAEISLSENRKLIVFSTWFTYIQSTKFGVKSLSDMDLVRLDKKYRLPSLKKLMGIIKNKYDGNVDDTPIVITGDHNAGSHLDFTEETIGLPQNYGRGKILLPLSHFLICKEGYVDSYRYINSSPIKKPGHTYSSVYHNTKKTTAFLKEVKKNKYNNGPHFRIDFVYSKGKKLHPVYSYTVSDFDGLFRTEDILENGKLKQKGTFVFPSDHSAVITTYEWLD